ncbi:MAG: hypothetical protein D6705_14690 [Deltaproteobacteria bacterium]|nr:MAG: hypothetical protein D6705_14690 [Deltaproteobacteria bacterium]
MAAGLALGPSARAVAGPATAAEAETPAPNDEVEVAKQLFYEGSARYSAADYTAAIDRFTRALEIVTRIGAEPKVRGALLLNLAKSHVRAYDVDTDVRHLRAAREIYRRFLREADELHYDAEGRAEAERELAALETRIAELEGAGGAEDAVGRREGATAAPDPQPPPEADRPKPPREKVVGGALVGVGAALALASIGPFVYGGVVLPRRTEDEIAKKDPPPDEERDFRDQEKKKQIAWFVGGSLMVAAGVGLVAGGAVLLRRAKKTGHQARRPRLMPMAGRHGVGLALSGRF